MTKSDVLDEVIEILIKKAMQDDPKEKKLKNSSKDRILRGGNKNGVYSSAGYRK